MTHVNDYTHGKFSETDCEFDAHSIPHGSIQREKNGEKQV